MLASTTPCTVLKGVGERVAARLAKLNIHTLEDLLFHLPLHYQDRTRVTPIANLQVEQYAVIEGIVIASEHRRGKRNASLLVRLQDHSKEIYLRFFHLYDQQHRLVTTINNRLRCFGQVRFSATGLEMVHPEFQLIDSSHDQELEKTLTPIYPATEGISQQTLRKLMQQAVDLLNKHQLIEEYLPADVLLTQHYPDLVTALNIVHFPEHDASIQALETGHHPARQRLAFEELLAHQISRRQLRRNERQYQAINLPINHALRAKFLASLNFSLTNAQQRVIADIEKDLIQSVPMMRLLHGDVGAGKTVVAAVAALQAIANGYQVAIMAPTEILAEQHLKNFQRWFAPLEIGITLVCSQLKVSEKRMALTAIADGTVKLIIGTHALFQADVNFYNLALVIIDEQHRFGVHQRLALQQKGMADDYKPHQLIMTATPIPRTLAMTAFADLDCSVLDELPPGRKPVETVAIANERRDEIITRIKTFCQQHKQVYWVCALIDESEQLRCEAAEKTQVLLQQELPELTIGLLHGRMTPPAKESTMLAFKQNKLDVLVATTVVEVGVDVPNASLMIIENAERFGLAQLHQLRGRVGRGADQSYCVLLYQMPLSLQAKTRLDVMRQFNDGFVVAEHDLKIRGPGEWLGTRQAGLLQFRVADLYRDAELLPTVQLVADQLINNYPDKTVLIMQRWIGDKDQYQRV